MEIIVPFLLGLFTVPTPERVDLEYTYEVKIDTSFEMSNFNNKPSPAKTTNLFLDLKCLTKLADRIVCRVGTLRNLYPMPELAPVCVQVDSSKLISPKDLDGDSFPFEIRFDANGIVSYVVEKNDEVTIKMMNVYRWITSPLSVGNYKKDACCPIEQDPVGYCNVTYNLERRSMNMSGNFHLISLSNLQFSSDDAVVITKQKRIDTDCVMMSNYVFSIRFWPELMFKHTESYRIVQSNNVMTLHKNGFQSKMTNRVDFYQKTSEGTALIGVAKESLSLTLKSYRIICAIDKYWMNDENAVEMVVSPNNNY
ncbi:PREDICTED: uncharacterized protein LOC106742739 isoform X5 [Dinoponera quadriceps]|uniref:Uncharacterized protein LOC106742739 isoform X5 n=1 Tax=Dinoponera quadriceps TaxID=609295 RepID=A0A6P3WZC7_DINQU|nr:PREDICTED: uncharacterized protein LOC106742739 isoform X5 [Dinoponera quadriceps]XP_014471448.1 PREDICTED: uncharacterized protein LOC106742739 isoform X5 [Dinoponera quadriceps]